VNWRKSSRMNTYAKRAANPCRMCTYEFIGLKVPCNEHLQKIGGGRPPGCKFYLQPGQIKGLTKISPLE
jgi:hypothetical protein